jgi:ribonuclease-3
MDSLLSEIETKLGYKFQDKKLLELSLIHRSYANEHRGLREHNERLEFLGDSVLNLIITETLYREHPRLPEGVLSHIRSRIVEASSCDFFAKKLGIDHYLLLGRGEKMNQGKGRISIVADFFEAIVGAIFLDGGYIAAHRFILENFSKEIERMPESEEKNFKAQLQDYTQKKHKETPEYIIVSESGPEHEKNFVVEVRLQGKTLAEGAGSSKKEAQQQAAKSALLFFNER